MVHLLHCTQKGPDVQGTVPAPLPELDLRCSHPYSFELSRLVVDSNRLENVPHFLLAFGGLYILLGESVVGISMWEQ